MISILKEFFIILSLDVKLYEKVHTIVTGVVKTIRISDNAYAELINREFRFVVSD